MRLCVPSDTEMLSESPTSYRMSLKQQKRKNFALVGKSTCDENVWVLPFGSSKTTSRSLEIVLHRHLPISCVLWFTRRCIHEVNVHMISTPHCETDNSSPAFVGVLNEFEQHIRDLPTAPPHSQPSYHLTHRHSDRRAPTDAFNSDARVCNQLTHFSPSSPPLFSFFPGLSCRSSLPLHLAIDSFS